MHSLLAGLFALASALPLAALDPGLRISQYQKSYWGVEQGLPHNYVTAIAQGHDGFLWIGTDEGLARFDGTNFKPSTSTPSLRWGQQWISSLLRARDGSLWAGTFEEGQLARVDGSGGTQTYVVGGSVFAMLQDSEGAFWVSSRKGVFRLAGGRIERVKGLTAPLETSWNVLSADARGNTWVVDSAGLHSCRGVSVAMAAANGGSHGDILTVLARGAGGVWLGTAKGLYHLPGQGASRPSAVAGVRGPVVSLLEDRDGSLWAGTWGNGVYRLHEGQIEGWTGREGLPDDFIRTLGEDSEGNLWIGMRSGGLGRWKEPRIVPVGAAEGLAGNYAATVAADPAGDLWLGTWRGGLYRLRNGALEPQTTPLPVLYFTVRALAFDPQGRPWAGNWEGIYGFDGRAYRHYATEEDAAFRRVSALHFDRRGALWVGTSDQGLFLFPGGRPVAASATTLLESSSITSLLEDSVGTMWVGTSRGLGRFEGAGGQGFQKEVQLGEESIESLFEDSRKRVWATTAGGSLLLITPSRRVVLDRRNGLPAHALYRLLEDNEGSFWISSPRGILELPRGPLEEVLAGRQTRLEILRYGQEDGMRTIECHGLSQPAGGKSRDGSLWFPTARGFVQIRPARPRTLEPPAAMIDEVRTDAGSLTPGGGITIEAGVRNLEVRFSALRFANPHKVQFRYRMQGFDPGWVDAGGERSARYNQLPPGRLALAVQARDPGGAWGREAVLPVTQRPRFHQTWWFLLLLAVASVGLVLGGYRWRLHSVRSRYAAVLEERNRIGREWHDTLVAGFSAISLQLEAAIARLNDQPSRSSEILEVTKKMVHHYRAEARRVIWDLRDSRPEGETLQAALESALGRIRESHGTEGAVTATGEPAELPVDVQHNILRICQEAMSNAVRHGKPTRVEVQLAFTADQLVATVRDDGSGFGVPVAEAESHGHFGLTVMRERARRIDAKLRIESQPGEGTLVEVALPLRQGKTP